MIGVLVTVVVQSSSASTSIIVSLVGAGGLHSGFLMQQFSSVLYSAEKYVLLLNFWQLAMSPSNM